MRIPLAGTAVALLALGTVSACGGDGDVEAFCASYEQLQRSGEDIITAEEGLAEVENLADTAPEEVRDEAETALDGYRSIADAVQDAGFALSDLDDRSALSEEEQQQLATAAQEADYDPEELSAAFAEIDTWSIDNCGSGAE